MRLFFSFFLMIQIVLAAEAMPAKTEFVYPDFTQCYEKNRQSIVYFGKIRAVAISENTAIAYSKEKPTVAYIKHDYLSNLYLFESSKALTPVKLKSTDALKPGEWLGSMSENSLIVVNFSKIGMGANDYFEHSGRGETNSIVGGLCCEMYGLGIGDKFFISSEAIDKFATSRSISYQKLGARFEENNETIVVDFVDPDNKEVKLKVGDKILALNGKKVKTLAAFNDVMMSISSSQILSAQIQRDNAWIEENILAVKPKVEPKKVVKPKSVSYLGVKGFNFDNDMKIKVVPPYSLLDKHGLKAGDKLLQVDGMPVHSMTQADSYFAKNTKRENSLLFERDDFQFFVTLTR